MQVFISWSGEQSKRLALALHDWLPLVVQAVKPWMSGENIEKGESWMKSIQQSLVDSKGMGIFCLTADNLTAPWLMFEAGAISGHDSGRVATMLFGIEPSAVKPPLSLFQATLVTERSDVFKLVQMVNARLTDPLSEAILRRAFDSQWTALQDLIAEIPGETLAVKPSTQESSQVILEEILGTVRRLEKDAGDQAARRKTDGLAVALASYIADVQPVENLGLGSPRTLLNSLYQAAPLKTGLLDSVYSAKSAADQAQSREALNKLFVSGAATPGGTPESPQKG
jgi:hypothetical protein